MQNTIQFITTKKDGRLIEIPQEFIDDISGEFRVILILNTKSEKPVSQKKS